MTTVILGLDPGLAALGWGVIVVAGASRTWRAHGVLRTSRDHDLAVGHDLALRVDLLAADLGRLIVWHQPDEAAIEEFRFYGKSVTSSLQVANVVGMLREALRARGVPVTQYSARDVKLAVTGDPNADKAAMKRMVALHLEMEAPPISEHAADALGVALTHAARLPVRRALAGSQ